MKTIAVALAGLAATVAVPATAATTIFSENFETSTNNSAGVFADNGNFAGTGVVKIETGQAYKNLGFGGTDPDKLANKVASFGSANNRGSGNILATTIAGSTTPTLYTINFDAGYIGGLNGDDGFLDQYLLFSATDEAGNSVTANLQPLGGQDSFATGELVGSSNVDTVFTRRYQYQFTGTGALSLSFTGGGARGDNADVLLDNVLVRAGAVPESSTWAMMIIGFGSLGGVMRRRRAPARLAHA